MAPYDLLNKYFRNFQRSSILSKCLTQKKVAQFFLFKIRRTRRLRRSRMLSLERRMSSEAALHFRRRSGDARQRRGLEVPAVLLGRDQVLGRRDFRHSTLRKS